MEGALLNPHELSRTQAAEALGVSRQMVHNWIKSGVLEARQVGHAWIISGESVEALKAKRNAPGYVKVHQKHKG